MYSSPVMSMTSASSEPAPYTEKIRAPADRPRDGRSGHVRGARAYTVPGPEITAASSGPGTPGCPSDARCELVATERYPLLSRHPRCRCRSRRRPVGDVGCHGQEEDRRRSEPDAAAAHPDARTRYSSVPAMRAVTHGSVRPDCIAATEVRHLDRFGIPGQQVLVQPVEPHPATLRGHHQPARHLLHRLHLEPTLDIGPTTRVRVAAQRRPVQTHDRITVGRDRAGHHLRPEPRQAPTR